MLYIYNVYYTYNKLEKVEKVLLQRMSTTI